MEYPIYIRNNAGSVAHGRPRTTSAEDEIHRFRRVDLVITNLEQTIIQLDMDQTVYLLTTKDSDTVQESR